MSVGLPSQHFWPVPCTKQWGIFSPDDTCRYVALQCVGCPLADTCAHAHGHACSALHAIEVAQHAVDCLDYTATACTGVLCETWLQTDVTMATWFVQKETKEGLTSVCCLASQRESSSVTIASGALNKS